MDARRVAHICVDVQTMFATGTDWHAPWLNRVLPAIEALVERDPGHTVFTRFIPPDRPEEAGGAWQDYYRRWPDMTGAREIDSQGVLYGNEFFSPGRWYTLDKTSGASTQASPIPLAPPVTSALRPSRRSC